MAHKPDMLLTGGVHLPTEADAPFGGELRTAHRDGGGMWRKSSILRHTGSREGGGEEAGDQTQL